jgi:hypothetical protein
MSMPWDQGVAPTRPQPAVPQPGWYPDPSGNPQLRWWDGAQWSSQMRSQPEPPAQPTFAPSPSPSPYGGWQAAPATTTAPSVTGQRASWREFARQHKVVTAVAVVTIVAIGFAVAAANWVDVVFLLALGALAGWVFGKHMRRTTYALTALLVVAAIAGSAGDFSLASSSAVSSGTSVAGGISYCELNLTWTTGSSMTIAEPLDPTTVVTSCAGMATFLTQNSEGDFTATVAATLDHMPTGICSDDGVTLVSAPTVAYVACDGLEQDISYLIAP